MEIAAASTTVHKIVSYSRSGSSQHGNAAIL